MVRPPGSDAVERGGHAATFTGVLMRTGSRRSVDESRGSARQVEASACGRRPVGTGSAPAPDGWGRVERGACQRQGGTLRAWPRHAEAPGDAPLPQRQGRGEPEHFTAVGHLADAGLVGGSRCPEGHNPLFSS